MLKQSKSTSFLIEDIFPVNLLYTWLSDEGNISPSLCKSSERDVPHAKHCTHQKEAMGGWVLDFCDWAYVSKLTGPPGLHTRAITLARPASG